MNIQKSLFYSLMYVIPVFSLHPSDDGDARRLPDLNNSSFQSRPTVINADLIVFHEKGSHTKINMPPAWRRELTFGENVLRTTQEAVTQGYKQSISTLISHFLVNSFYKLYACIVGASEDELAQQQSVRQKELGNLLLLLRNNKQLIQECEIMKCTDSKCEQTKNDLRESLEKQQQDLLAALAKKTTNP